MPEKPHRRGSVAIEGLVKESWYIANLERIEKKEEENRREFNEAAKPLNDALAAEGFPHIEELLKRREYREALPILLEWLPKISNYSVKESIVRALTVPWAKPSATPVLIEEFRSADESADSYKWAIGNALETIGDPRIANELIELLRDKRHGSDRQMLAIALGKIGDLRAVDVLTGLLDDKGMTGHAIIGLGKLRDPRARPRIEPFLNHQNAWIRREAKKALERIDKGQQARPSKRQSRGKLTM